MTNRPSTSLAYPIASLLASIAACLLAAASGCGSSVDASADATIAPTAAAACTALATSRCTRLQACSPSDLARRFGTLSACETREELACTDALAAPMTANSPSAVVACSQAIDAESCGELFTKAPPAACTTQLGTGTGACSFSAQCATGFCAIEAGALCGTCATQPVVGTSCATASCGQALTCVTSTMTCQELVAASGACSRDKPCADGLTCVGANPQMAIDGICMAEVTATDGTCDAKHRTGADCSSDGGLTCDTTTNTCVAQPLAAAGASCGVMTGITTKCTGAATCVIPAPQTVGTCVAPAADGAACDTVAGPTCLTPARCVPTTAGGTAGTCQLPGSATCS